MAGSPEPQAGLEDDDVLLREGLASLLDRSGTASLTLFNLGRPDYAALPISAHPMPAGERGRAHQQPATLTA
jgi:hypothetical protein